MRKTDRERVAFCSRASIMGIMTLFFALVCFLYYGRFAFDSHLLQGNIATVFLFTILYDCFCRLYKAYKISAYPIGETVFSQVLSFGLADLILYIEFCLMHNGYVSVWPGLLTAAAQTCAAGAWALGCKRYYIRCVKPRSTLIISGASDAKEFVHKLAAKYAHIFAIEELLECSLPAGELFDRIEKYETVILYEVPYGLRTGLITHCLNEKKTFYMTPRISDVIIKGFESRHMIDTPLLKYEYGSDRMLKWLPKRVLDILLSFLGLVLTLPVTMLTAFLIKLEDGGDIFFRQQRYTKDWKSFEIIKFRSMVMDAEKDGGARPCTAGDTRITRVGNVIRRFRIDEIPQLWNVLKGDMSIVGPRPERIEHVHAYVKELPEFAYRLRVKGGLTGYAQIYGKYNTSAYDKLKLDLMYIENQSILMDLKLILLTVKTIFIPESTEGFSEEKSEKIKTNSEKVGGLAIREGAAK